MSSLFFWLAFFTYLCSSLGTTIVGTGGSSSPVWADVIEGTEGDDFIVGAQEDDQIDSKGAEIAMQEIPSKVMVLEMTI